MRTKSLKKFTKFFLRKDHFCAWFLTFSKNLAESFSKAEKRNWEKFFFRNGYKERDVGYLIFIQTLALNDVYSG